MIAEKSLPKFCSGSLEGFSDTKRLKDLIFEASICPSRLESMLIGYLYPGTLYTTLKPSSRCGIFAMFAEGCVVISLSLSLGSSCAPTRPASVSDALIRVAQARQF